MLMVKAQGGVVEKYPYSAGDLFSDFPQTSFPSNLGEADLSEFGVFPVTVVPAPTADYTQVVVEGDPLNVGGNWTQVWIVRDATDAEEAAAMAEIEATYSKAVQNHLDATARTRNYDNILSACSYAAGSHPKYSVEGQDCLNWREAVWDKCYEILGDVSAGNRPLPTVAEVIAELPPMVWSN